jgi:hypothetical protein
MRRKRAFHLFHTLNVAMSQIDDNNFGCPNKMHHGGRPKVMFFLKSSEATEGPMGVLSLMYVSSSMDSVIPKWRSILPGCVSSHIVKGDGGGRNKRC